MGSEKGDNEDLRECTKYKYKYIFFWPEKKDIIVGWK